MEIRKRLRAFTLVELLIVITIIGILAVALVPRITGAPAKARDAARKADLQQIATGLELYADEYGYYPAAVADACASELDLSAYMTSVPTESSPDSTATSCVQGAAGYGYNPIDGADADTNAEGYILTARIEIPVASDGIYQVFSPSGTDTAGDELTGATECSSSSTDCMYVIGR